MVQEKEEMVRKRVLYVGSAVPTETAEGLDAIQKPLLQRYPVDDDCNIEGILSFVSVMPGGLTLQYISDPGHILFFPISSLVLCAAVRCVTTENAGTGRKSARFVSLSSPAAGGANCKRPAIFTTITRRTEGRKVLECHGFICASSKDALDLVQFTSFADRLSKGKINGSLRPMGAAGGVGVGGGGYTLDASSSASALAGDSNQAQRSPRSPVAGPDGEHPVRLVAGETVSQQQRVAPEFYEPPPQQGYFYKTNDSQIKTYTVERVMEGEAERIRAISNSAPGGPHHHHPPTPQHVGMAATLTRDTRRPMTSGPHVHPAGAMTLPHPQGRTLIPVRAIPPSAAMVRPRFFSPPPPLLRPRPMGVPQGHVMARGDPYVFLPPPPGLMDAPYVVRRRPPRRAGSDSSSRGSSGSSSPGGSPRSPRAVNGGRGVVNGDGGGDGSSDVSSRPRTPPTDYDRGPRVSRKEQFDRNQRYLREVNGERAGHGAHFAPPPGHLLPPPPAPYDFYVYPPPPRYGYPGYPPYVLERARSMPPPLHRGKSKDRKKGRKGKKEKKKKSKRAHGVPSDVSTDSIGYTSEVPPGADYPRMPRDFRRFENQFKHERAFSKSLAEEGYRGGAVPEAQGNAYSLNEHMVQRSGEGDFNLLY